MNFLRPTLNPVFSFIGPVKTNPKPLPSKSDSDPDISEENTSSGLFEIMLIRPARLLAP